MLLIPAMLLATSKDFTADFCSTKIPSVVVEPSMTILASYVVGTPLSVIRTFKSSFDFAPSLYPSIIFSGGTSIFDAPYMKSLPEVDNPIVLATSTDSNSIDVSVIGTSFGGTICVIYPRLSCENASFLNPLETSAFAPKLELELVSEISPPFSVTKCSAYPIAKQETA